MDFIFDRFPMIWQFLNFINFYILGSGDSSSNKMVSESCKMTNEVNSDQMMANGNNAAGSALSKVNKTKVSFFSLTKGVWIVKAISFKNDFAFLQHFTWNFSPITWLFLHTYVGNFM